MDSDSVGNRSKKTRKRKSDNVDNAKKSVEEVPKILSPEVQDVFSIFASMLNISSFVKLAMTSKEMYRRCMENNSITINLDEMKLDVSSRPLNFSFEIDEDDEVVLRKLPFKVNVRTLEIQNSTQPEVYAGSVVQRMKDYGINEINELNIINEIHELNIKKAIDERTITTVIKEFGVKSVNIYHPIAVNALRSILQLNMTKFSYHGPVSADFILEIDSPIRELEFSQVRNISKNKLMAISSKIQSSSLRSLAINNDAVNWNDVNKLPFDHKGALPDERPLVLTRTCGSVSLEYWLLHWNGRVTKFVITGPTLIQISKCELWELPYICRKEEEILKDLLEQRNGVSCSAGHFHTFCAGFEMIDASHEGPLPDVRPLYCKVSDNRFWRLDEDDKVMKCNWEDGCVTWTSFDPYRRGNYMEHPALAKHMFWKLLRQVEGSDEFFLNFDKNPKLFEGFEKLEMDYSGDLPSARPLIFERSSEAHSCVVLSIILLDDGRLIECRVHHGCGFSFKLCHCSNRPTIFFTAESVAEILKDWDREIYDVNMNFKLFRDGLKQFKKSALALQNRILILETSKTEFWYLLEGEARKAEWKKGRLSITEDGDLIDCPSSLVFRYFAQNPETCDSFRLEFEQLRNCLEQFTVVPFDYSGPLTNDSPLVIVKNEIRHTCRKGPTRRPRCNCDVHSVLVWFLWNGTRLTTCSWRKKNPRKIVFSDSSSYNLEVPAMLKSKEYLKNLLETKYDESSQFEWFGSFDDFFVNLNDYVKLPFDHDAPLPAERPLLFEDSSNKKNPNCFILRDDGTIVKCEWLQSNFSFSSPGNDDLPPALKNIF